MTATEERISTLFDELVPASGKADTVAGEIIRAISRIGYRNYNDGDHLGVGYGKETCNPAGRFLAVKCGAEIADLVYDAWGDYCDTTYDEKIARLEEAVVAYIDDHPELREKDNAEDMWEYRDPDEDTDDDDYDDDDEEYYDDDEEEW